MIPCIVTYFLVQFGTFPSIGNVWLNHEHSYQTSYILRENYLFYVYSDFYGIRFNGPFVEPGHLGMMSAFLLFANGFEVKRKDNMVILGTIILTLSLAGYAFAFIGYLFVLYGHGKIRFSRVMLFILTIFLIYLFANYYNGGDNLLNEKILSRLESDKEKGFSGNNRVDTEVMLYFYSMFSDEKLLLFGYGKDMYDWLLSHRHGGTGIYMWTVQFGIIGSIAAMIFYLSYTMFSKERIVPLLFFLFVVILFWQRSYPFWYSWIICFVYGITNHKIAKRYGNRSFNIS